MHDAILIEADSDAIDEQVRLMQGDQAQPYTWEVWPERVSRQSPEAASQIFRVLSQDAESTRRPSGDQAQPATAEEWPERVSRQSPEAASQIFRVLSPPRRRSERPG